MRVCNVAGCGRLTDAGKCQEHRRERWRATAAKRPSNREQGRTREWYAESKKFLAAFPRCERCGAEATVTHHVDGLGPSGTRGFDWRNFEALCASCHNRTTGQEHGFGSGSRARDVERGRQR